MRDAGSPWKPRPPRGAPSAIPPPRAERNDPPPAAQPAPAREQRDVELRLYGLNAIRAVFAKRPQAIRKLYLAEARIPQLQPLLKWCVANRVGYQSANAFSTAFTRLAGCTPSEFARRPA